ncbi:MAG: envelope stress response membrane protein PspB [Geminicoccaceae bacterium]
MMVDIGELIPLVAVSLGLGLVAPLAIFMHYFTRWRTNKSLSADDERLLDELWRTAQALEKRIETMETILTRDVPEGRTQDD